MAVARRVVPANDFAEQWRLVRDDVSGAIERVGSSGWYVLGAEVQAFETELSEWFGVDHVVGCASGLDAIEIALRALELPAGSRILTTPLSAYATALAVTRAGHVPVFGDVDASGILDVEAAADIVASDPRIRAILPVHLFGHAADLDRFEAIAREASVALVEDAAQAIGAHSHGRAVGSVGIASATSFYPTKNLGTLGDGGALATGSAEIAGRARALRDYGQSSKYVHDVPGLNSRLDEIHAAILRSAMLPRLGAWTARRQAIADRYRAGLDTRHLSVVPTPSGSESVWHLFPVLVEDVERRAAFLQHLRDAGVGAAVHYPVLITDQAALTAFIDNSVIPPTPSARRFASAEVSLPISPLLIDDDVDYVTSVCNGWNG